MTYIHATGRKIRPQRTRIMPKTPSITSPQIIAYLDHVHQARLARTAMTKQGLTVTEVAERSGLTFTTVQRFMALGDMDATVYPRTATTVRIFEALGYRVAVIST